MRTFRAAFHPFLLAVRAEHEISFRPHQEINDETEHAGNNGHDREQHRVIHPTALCVFVNPDGQRDPNGEDDQTDDTSAGAANESADCAAGFVRIGILREKAPAP